jgi:hypothetical protein
VTSGEMRVHVVFPDGTSIDWGFAGNNVPREGDVLAISDPNSPRDELRVTRVRWRVTERGCAEVELHTSYYLDKAAEPRPRGA